MMNRNLNIALMILLGLTLLLGLAACSDDDDDKTDPTTPVVEDDLWVGNWLCSGAGIPFFVSADPVNVDTVDVTMNADNTITTLQHNSVTGNWTTSTGTYSVTESATGDVHAISITYTDLEQVGIIKVVEASPDSMYLELVPSTYTPAPTVEHGFGYDYGELNIQKYLKQ